MNEIKDLSLYKPGVLKFTLNGRKYISDGVIIVLQKHWLRYGAKGYLWVKQLNSDLRSQIINGIKDLKECNKDEQTVRVSNCNNIDSVDQNINGYGLNNEKI